MIFCILIQILLTFIAKLSWHVIVGSGTEQAKSHSLNQQWGMLLTPYGATRSNEFAHCYAMDLLPDT